MVPARSTPAADEGTFDSGGLRIFFRAWHPWSQLFFYTVGSVDKTLKFYDGGFHDLLNDVGKEEVMADITAWIAARLTVGSGERK
jgi:hypothetical protein